MGMQGQTFLLTSSKLSGTAASTEGGKDKLGLLGINKRKGIKKVCLTFAFWLTGNISKMCMSVHLYLSTYITVALTVTSIIPRYYWYLQPYDFLLALVTITLPRALYISFLCLFEKGNNQGRDLGVLACVVPLVAGTS